MAAAYSLIENQDSPAIYHHPVDDIEPEECSSHQLAETLMQTMCWIVERDDELNLIAERVFALSAQLKDSDQSDDTFMLTTLLNYMLRSKTAKTIAARALVIASYLGACSLSYAEIARRAGVSREVVRQMSQGIEQKWNARSMNSRGDTTRARCSESRRAVLAR